MALRSIRMRVAVLDLGSNSFRMLVADTGIENTVTRVLLEREMLQLGAVVGQHGELPAAELAESAAAVKHLAALANRTGVDRLEAVATSAIRDAANREHVLEVLSEAAGVPVRVLTGEQEASTSFSGVRGAVGMEEEPLVVLDLGGGSLEVVTGDVSGVTTASSYPLGVSRLHAEFVKQDPMGPGAAANLRARVHDAIPTGDYSNRVVAVGGTVRALAQIHAASTRSWTPASLNLLEMPTVDLGALADSFAVMSGDERNSVPGMRSSRAEHIGTAAIILHEALVRIGAESFQVSDWGLREGIVLEDHVTDREFDADRLRRSEVEALRVAFGPDDGHAELVARLGVEIFDETTELHNLGSQERDLLEFGLLLHDIGKVLATDGYQRHSAYLVENAELRGFTPTEIAVLASLVRFSRSGRPKASFPPYQSLLPDWEVPLAQMTAIVQLADGLDWASDLAVEGIEVGKSGSGWQLRLLGDEATMRTDVATLTEHRFQKAFGVPLTIDAPTVL